MFMYILRQQAWYEDSWNTSPKRRSRHCAICRLRWTVRGIPRVPWEAEGIFDGISEYKLDKDGKIYEHKVTNVQMRDPPLARSLESIGLNMIPVPRLQRAPQVCTFTQVQHVNSVRHMSIV